MGNTNLGSELHMHAASNVANNLLRALRADDLEIIKPILSVWQAKNGQVLHEPGDVVEFAFFPCGPTLSSYTVVLPNGHHVETAMIGREGAAGGIVSNGRLPAYARCVVHHGGTVLRASLGDIDRVKSQSPAIRNLFSRYADCLVAQVFQSVACNAAHTIEQRTAKWVLAAIERTGDRTITLTQEQLATMMGVGRSYVSRVIQTLKSIGAVETRRGSLVIRDMETMNRLSCRCNEAVKGHFREVLAGVYPG